MYDYMIGVYQKYWTIFNLFIALTETWMLDFTEINWKKYGKNLIKELKPAVGFYISYTHSEHQISNNYNF